MLRPSLLLSAFLLALSLVCPAGALAGGGLGLPGAHLIAVYHGQLIPLVEVAQHHCHDRATLTIHCFDTEEERDQDANDQGQSEDGVAVGAGALSVSASISLSLQSVIYVIWYEDADYDGSSFSASGPVPNLGTFGWNNRISSFKSTNGGRPKWWDSTYYQGAGWQWGISAWVPYVGDNLDNRFTSVQNVL
jgi:hypothetical protein